MRYKTRYERSGTPLFLLLCLAACGESPAEPAIVGNAPPTAPIQAAIDSFRAAHPGVLSAIGLVQTASGDLRQGWSGFLDDSRTLLIQPDSRFGIGSTTKTFTATMVLQLVEEGLVDLDGPLAQYVAPAWKAVLDSVPYSSEITVRHALSHRSGIYDYLVSPLQSQFLSDPGRIFTPLEAFRFVTSGAPNSPPGTDFHYSNTNFLLLGHIVENLTGQPYVEALNARILSPVGLENTFMYHGSSSARREGIAHSYATIGGLRFDILDFSRSGWAWAVGGLVSTTGDLVKFLDALGSGLLFDDSRTLEAMTDLGENTWYGLGVQIDDYPTVGRCFGHGGHAFGSTAQVRHCPEAGITFGAFYAGDGSNLGAHLDIVDRMLRAVN